MATHDSQSDFIILTTHKCCRCTLEHYEQLSFIIQQSDGLDSARPSFSATFLCVRKVSSNYFLPGALQYKASSPRAQRAEEDP